MSARISGNLKQLTKWDHFYPSKSEITSVVSSLFNLGAENLICRIDNRTYVNETQLYKFLETRKIKNLIKYFNNKEKENL